VEKSANLCWGQRYHWLRYQHVPAGARHDAHIVVHCPLPPGISPTDLRTAVNYLVRRHEALRTVVVADATGEPRQVVQPPAPLPLSVATTDRDGTPGPAEVVRELTETEFVLDREWPIRACLVTTAGAPIRLVVVLNHLAFDDWSLNAFRREFEATVTAIVARRRAALPPVAQQPVDLARYEAGRAAGVAADLAYWRREIAALPADVWLSRRTAPPEPPVAHSASLTSPGLLTAARKIAARHGTWPSVVHLAAYAVAVAAYTSEPVVPFRWLTSHREDNPYSSVMTCMFSPTLISVELADDPPFSELLRRLHARVEQARAHAYVPYDEVAELFAAESARRGQPVRVASELNFLSYAPRSCGARRDRFAWNPSPTAWARSDTDSYLSVHEWSDGVTLALHARDDVLPAAEVERFLRGLLRLIEAHRDEAVDLSVTAAAALFGFPPEEAGTLRLAGDAVRPEAIEATLLAHPGVVDARVTVERGELVARVRCRPGLDVAELRTHLLGGMYDRPGVRCPELIELLPDPTAGDGGPGTRPGVAVSPAEQALTEAVARVNGLTTVDPLESYPLVGGRALRVPATLAALRAAGWTGLTPDLLASARPLRTLADRLQPVG
jgi:hypothetical protein